MFKRVSLQVKISLVILIPLVIMLIISNTVNIIYVRKSTVQLIYSILNNNAKYEVSKLKSFMEKDSNYAVGFANTISGFYNDGILNRDFYERMSSYFFDNLSENVVGLLMAFEPNSLGNDNDYINSEKYAAAGGRFNSYLLRNAGNIQQSNLNKDIFQKEYYTEVLKSGRIYVTDVYSSPLHNNAMIYIGVYL